MTGPAAHRPRVEDGRFLSGLGRYTADVLLERQAQMVVLRSPHAHALIRGIDTSAARRLPGVLAIVTGTDLAAAGLGSIPCVSLPRRADGSVQAVIQPPYAALPTDRVRHVGEAVAAIVAETAEGARNAAEAVVVDYAPLPAVTDAKAAATPGAPALWDQAPGNLSFTYEIGDAAAVRQAMAAAHHVARLRLVNQRVSANPIEPRAALGAWDAAEGRYHLIAPLQTPHQVRGVLAQHVLKVPERMLRVTSPDVGGGFGMKGGLFREHALVLFLARRLGRPVVWVADRTESFLSDDHARDNVTEAALALDREGRFLALSVETDANLGAYVSLRGAHSPTNNLGSLSGVYVTPAIHARVRGVLTNTAPTSPYRGAGRPEATYLLERIIDVAAAETGLDRVEIRRRNLIPAAAMPYQTKLLFHYDSGDFARGMALAAEAADWAGFPERRMEAMRRGRLRGIGLANAIEQSGGPMGAPWEERAEIRFDPGGGITLLVGTLSNGQGHETVFAELLAARLGVPRDLVRVVQGDTDLVAFGRGTFGSRSIAVGGSAIGVAAEKVIAKGRGIAAHLMEADIGDVTFEEGHFAVAGTDRSVPLQEVVRTAFAAHRLPEGMEPGLDAVALFAPKAPTYPNGCHVCEVEVDPDTGAAAVVRYLVVDDVGTVLDHALLAGQVHGGVAQGLGQALLEGVVYEPGSGQLLTASFMDYGMPRAADMPPMELHENPQPTPTNPLGAKGGGEAGTIGAPPAVINALVDALRDHGVRHIEMPATSERVWRALHGARA